MDRIIAFYTVEVLALLAIITIETADIAYYVRVLVYTQLPLYVSSYLSLILFLSHFLFLLSLSVFLSLSILSLLPSISRFFSLPLGHSICASSRYLALYCLFSASLSFLSSFCLPLLFSVSDSLTGPQTIGLFLCVCLFIYCLCVFSSVFLSFAVSFVY